MKLSDRELRERIVGHIPHEDSPLSLPRRIRRQVEGAVLPSERNTFVEMREHG